LVSSIALSCEERSKGHPKEANSNINGRQMPKKGAGLRTLSVSQFGSSKSGFLSEERTPDTPKKEKVWEHQRKETLFLFG